MVYLTNCMRGDVNQARLNIGWSDIVVGRPEATATYTVEQLEAKGYVGLYRTTNRVVNPPRQATLGMGTRRITPR